MLSLLVVMGIFFCWAVAVVASVGVGDGCVVAVVDVFYWWRYRCGSCCCSCCRCSRVSFAVSQAVIIRLSSYLERGTPGRLPACCFRRLAACYVDNVSIYAWKFAGGGGGEGAV